MCTLLVATRLWRDTPLLVAANRDEHLGRPAAAPSLRRNGDRKVFAPIDLRAGGTWMGVNDAGVLVAITNRFTGEAQPPPDDGRPSKVSRGQLVEEALARPDAAAASQYISAIDADAYNGFHLLCADASSAWVTWSDTRVVRRQQLQPGLHVITERSYGAAPSLREDSLIALASALSQQDDHPTQQLEEELKTHREQPIESTCVHLADLGYGTRSSSIVRFGQEGPLTYHFAPGPPCTTRYEDLSQEMLLGFRSGDQRVAT